MAIHTKVKNISLIHQRPALWWGASFLAWNSIAFRVPPCFQWMVLGKNPWDSYVIVHVQPCTRTSMWTARMRPHGYQLASTRQPTLLKPTTATLLIWPDSESLYWSWKDNNFSFLDQYEGILLENLMPIFCCLTSHDVTYSFDRSSSHVQNPHHPLLHLTHNNNNSLWIS